MKVKLLKQNGKIVEIPNNVALRWINAGIACYPEMYNMQTTDNPIIDYIDHRVSIVIPVLNALQYFKMCLDSLVKYTRNYELIIIDNGSNKVTKDYLECKQKELGFKLQTNEKNMGFSYACNQGIKLATCDYICFLNSDTVLTPNWLVKLIKGFDMPNAGIVGPSTCWSAGKQCMRELMGRRASMSQDDMNMVRTGTGIVEIELYGFCYMVSRKLIDDIGVFDVKRYPIGSAEEKDFSWRAGKAGYKSYHIKDSYVHHFGSKTFIETGINPHSIRVENDKNFEKRKSDPNTYIENTVEVDLQLEPIPILMIVLDRLEYTKQAIGAIFKNTFYPFKLFIFNNGSNSQTTDYLNSLEDSRIEIYHSKVNVGLIPPMNMFFDKFKNYKYVAKVDNDTVVSPDWLGKLKDVMDTFPLFTVEANHYLAMPFKIDTNDDFYKHLFGIRFNESMLYFYNCSGGTGQLIRRNIIDRPVTEIKGTLSGWTSYQNEKFKSRGCPSGFYTGTWIDRLDQVATNKYGKSDYPEYDKIIKKMRPWGIGYYKMNPNNFIGIKRDMEKWYRGL